MDTVGICWSIYLNNIAKIYYGTFKLEEEQEEDEEDEENFGNIYEENDRESIVSTETEIAHETIIQERNC